LIKILPCAEIVRVTPHHETNVEFAQLSMALGWTHRMNVVVFDKNPLRRGGPPCPPAQDGWPTFAFVAPMLFLNRTPLTLAGTAKNFNGKSDYDTADPYTEHPTSSAHPAEIAVTLPSFRLLAQGEL
jgi:hypothetical protein